MEILNQMTSAQLRKKYIDVFIDKESEHYRTYILPLKEYVDGECYLGYLWDCFKYKIIKTGRFCEEKLKEMGSFYIFWDINSCENIAIPNYWKYPKDAFLKVDFSEYLEIKDTLPEDIYCFDDSFSWSVALTHEDIRGERFCYLAFA